MKFVDETVITVQSGDGGNGCVSFRRERHVPRGGPDGGDGGKGGDVILKATSRRRTLYDFHFKRQFKAKNGRPGQGKQKTGKNAEDVVIEIPPGTIVSDVQSGQVLRDLIRPEDTFTAAAGGRGGQGNARFKTSTNRAPRFAQPGESGQTLTLKLELKLIADVGIIGLPNAGKSTLIRSLSSARPKTGAYPFTTLSPNLGVVQTGWCDPFVMADIPGLIAGAHKGAGLGTRFLRHIERTRILVHLIDASAIDPLSPLESYQVINAELSHYSPQLVNKPQIVVLNKMDLEAAEKAAAAFVKALADTQTLKISAKESRGLEALNTRILQVLESIDEP